ncbi:MAG: hypothetical protein V1729_01765 [Candidatus Woesearchaeota archaeon]
MILIAGCGSNSCGPEKVYEKRAITKTVEKYIDEQYVVQENKVIGEKCVEQHYSEMNNSRFSISVEEPEWVSKPLIPGETNYLRRVINIFNSLDEIDAIYLDKIYLYNQTETKRSKTPLMFLVDPKSIRTLYVMWNTQYDPLKDVTVDVTNNTEAIGFETRIMRICYNETEQVNVTKYKRVLDDTEEQITGYDDVVKVKLNRKC